MPIRRSVAAPSAALLFAANLALAVCNPLDVHEVYVGDFASDSSCTYDSIQAALARFRLSQAPVRGKNAWQTWNTMPL